MQLREEPSRRFLPPLRSLAPPRTHTAHGPPPPHGSTTATGCTALLQVYTNPKARICLARKMYEDVRLDIAEAYRRLVESPADVTVRDVDLMSACIYGDR